MMKPILVDKDYICDHLSGGIYLFTFTSVPTLELTLKDLLNKYPQKKTLCFNLSPYELKLSESSDGFMETHKFQTSSEIINSIREFGKDESAGVVIINSYLLLDAQEKWFLNNLLDLSCKFNLKIIILETIVPYYRRPIPKQSKIKKLLTNPYNYSNKVYYILPVEKYISNEMQYDYRIYVYK